MTTPTYDEIDALLPFVRKIFAGGLEGFVFDACPMMGAWALVPVAEGGVSFYVTPFWDENTGIPFDVCNLDGDAGHVGVIPFSLTDDPEQDASDFVALVLPHAKRALRQIRKIDVDERVGDFEVAAGRWISRL